MGNFIIVAIIIVFVVYNLISNYMKEQRKTDERKRAAKSIILENFPPINSLPKQEKGASVIRESSIEYSTLPKQSFSHQSPLSDKKNVSSITSYSYLDQHEDYSYSPIKVDEEYKHNVAGNKPFLYLNSSDDYKRAFLYSLIFDRKY